MSRAQAREAVWNYFANVVTVPYVGQVYRARTYISEQDYEQHMSQGVLQYTQSDQGSGAVLVVNLPNTKRQRQTLSGRGAVDDTEVHAVDLEVFFANVSGDPLAAQRDHDCVCDAIVEAIRDDPLLGTGGDPIWSAGEFRQAITVRQVEPYTDEEGMTVFIPAVVSFQAWIWVAGSV